MKPITLTWNSLCCISAKFILGKAALVFYNSSTNTNHFIYINYLLDYIPDILILETFVEDHKDYAFDILTSTVNDAILDISSEGIVKSYFEKMKNE